MNQSKSMLTRLLVCLAEIVAGVLLLANPEGFLSLIVRIGSIVLIVMGIVAIIQYFRTPAEETIGQNGIIRGLLFLLLGILLIMNADAFTVGFALFTLPIMAIFFAFDLLVMGFLKLQGTIDMIRLKSGHWVFMLISMILSIVLGLMILFNPFAATAALWIFAGISLIVEGIMDAIMGFIMK